LESGVRLVKGGRRQGPKGHATRRGDLFKKSETQKGRN